MNEPTGLVPRILAHLFGERAGRLTERAAPAHWLSYVLILSQSAAVLLVFGHAELPLLGSPSWAVRAIAAMGLFVLLATVFAADMAMLASLKRIPILARNRQQWALREHLGYVLFVLVTEAVTLGVVLNTLDAQPLALISARPLIPPDSLAFRAQIVLRVTLISWSAIQLVVIRGKLPVLLSTLTNAGKELVGGHVQRQLSALDIAGVALPDTFRLYAAMARPSRRVRTWSNGWLLQREMAAEAEEERQTANVVTALEELERRRVQLAPVVQIVDDRRPPTGGGTPALGPGHSGNVVEIGEERKARKRRGVRTPRRAGASSASVEHKARAVWEPDMSVESLQLAAGISRGSAMKYHKLLTAEAEATREEVAQ